MQYFKLSTLLYTPKPLMKRHDFMIMSLNIFNHLRNNMLHTSTPLILCRHKCFTQQTFGDCLKVLLIPDEEVSQLQYFIKVINGSPIPFEFQALN